MAVQGLPSNEFFFFCLRLIKKLLISEYFEFQNFG